MALTATLALDVKAFEAGLSKATASLEGFADKTIKNTNRDLSRLLEGFTGQKVVAEAERMAEAVTRIGGASRLTESEQRRVNASVTEAIEKYQALGQQAPAHLLRLQQETSGAVQKTSLLTQGMQVLVGLFSARAILRAAGDVLEFTGKLSDLSAKTGMTAEALQRLQYVTSQSGVSLDQIADGAVKLGRNLVSGNDSAVKGVEALKLNVQALIAQGPERAFLAIGEAIAKVPNPMEQAALSTAIFGRAGAEYLPAFTANMGTLAEQAQKSGAILSNDMVKAGDAAGDALTRMKASGMAVMGQLLIPMLPAVEALANLLSANLPSAVLSSRSAFDSLIRKGLEFNVWLAETAASITSTAASVPVLGRMFGQTSSDVEFFNAKAQHAKDTLKLFDLEGVKPAAAAMQAATPLTTTFGNALETTGKKGREAATAIGAVQGPAAELANLESRSTMETAKLTKELEKWADINGARLAPSIQQVSAALQVQTPLVNTMQQQWAGFAPTVQQNVAAAGGGIKGFFAEVFGGGQGLSSSLSTLFQQAFTGGGGALGAVRAFATQSLSTMLGMIPGVGQWASAFAGPIVSMLSNLMGKFKNFFSGIFGASGDEKAGRAAVAEFEQSLWSTLNATQELEAGGEAWKKTIIALRDAYIAQGRAGEEALTDAERLWKSSRISAEESAKVIAEIQAKLNALPTDKTITIHTEYDGQEAPSAGGRPSPGSGESSSAVMNARVRESTSGMTGGGTIRVPVYLDGFQIAMAVAPHRNAANRRWGV